MWWMDTLIFSPLQVLTGGRHALQQGGAPLLGSLPDRRLLDALRRPERQQSDPVEQTARAPAALLAGLHPRLRQETLRGADGKEFAGPQGIMLLYYESAFDS